MTQKGASNRIIRKKLRRDGRYRIREKAKKLAESKLVKYFFLVNGHIANELEYC